MMVTWVVEQVEDVFRVLDEEGRMQAVYPSLKECHAYIAGYRAAKELDLRTVGDMNAYVNLWMSKFAQGIPTWRNT